MIELVAAEGYSPTEINGGDGRAKGVAVDGSGNLFVGLLSLTHKPGVLEFLQADGYTTTKILGSGFNQIEGLTADSAGNVFVIDNETDKAEIKEIEAAGGYTTVKTLTGRITGPNSLAVDSAENVYVFSDKLYEIVADGGYTQLKEIAPNEFLEGDLAVDGSGNIFLAGETDSEIFAINEFPRSKPPVLAFDTTILGSTSANSPVSASVQNVGNASLTLSGLSLTDETDFSLAAGPDTPPACTNASKLAPSVECNLSVDFTPQSAGPLTGSLVLTDNQGNATEATQSVALSGTGSTVLISPTTLNFGSVPYPATASQPLTITNVGTGTLTIDPSSNGRSTVITGSTCGAGIAAGKSCALQVEFRPVRLGPNGNTLTIATNQAATPYLSVPASGTATGIGTLTTSISFGTLSLGEESYFDLEVINYGVAGSPTVAAETGAVSFTVISNGCTAGVTAGNTCDIDIMYYPAVRGTQTAYLKLIPTTGGPVQLIKMTGTAK